MAVTPGVFGQAKDVPPANGFQFLLQLSVQATKAVVALFANPTVAGISIEAESYSERGAVSVSKQLLIVSTRTPELSAETSKQFVSDNLAPHPRTFSIKGYLSDIIPVNFQGYMPLLEAKKAVLRKARNSHSPVLFTTPYRSENLLVAITDLGLDYDPTVVNKAPISITLQEIPILQFKTLTGADAVPGAINNPAAVPVPSAAATAAPVSPAIVLGL